MGDHRGEFSPDHVEVRGVGSVGVGRRPEDEKIKRLKQRKLKLTLAGGCGCRYRGRRVSGCLDSRRRRQRKSCQCACRWHCLEKNKYAFLYTKKRMDKGDHVICVVKNTNTNIQTQKYKYTSANPHHEQRQLCCRGSLTSTPSRRSLHQESPSLKMFFYYLFYNQIKFCQ